MPGQCPVPTGLFPFIFNASYCDTCKRTWKSTGPERGVSSIYSYLRWKLSWVWEDNQRACWSNMFVFIDSVFVVVVWAGFEMNEQGSSFRPFVMSPICVRAKLMKKMFPLFFLLDCKQLIEIDTFGLSERVTGRATGQSWIAQCVFSRIKPTIIKSVRPTRPGTVESRRIESSQVKSGWVHSFILSVFFPSHEFFSSVYRLLSDLLIKEPRLLEKFALKIIS